MLLPSLIIIFAFHKHREIAPATPQATRRFRSYQFAAFAPQHFPDDFSRTSSVDLEGDITKTDCSQMHCDCMTIVSELVEKT